MQQQRWRAQWRENGVHQELVFTSTTSRGVARVDFRLQAQRAGLHPPECVDREEVAAISAPAWLLQEPRLREATGGTDV